MSTLLPALLGLAFGLRHALEPDHLAAVSTLASEQKGVRASLGVGLSWGLGHALTLLVFGGALSAFEVVLSRAWAAGFELVVGAVVVALGLRAVLRALREGRRGPVALHRHQGRAHAHASGGEHVHLSRFTLATRPLLVGALHGLAGSGALVALVLLELQGLPSRLLYLALFGLGAALAMSGLTAVAGLPLQRLARAPRTAAWLLGLSGALSTVVGAAWTGASARALL